MPVRGNTTKYRWFCLQVEHTCTPLGNPSYVQSMAGLEPSIRPEVFDVFIHVYYPTAGNSSGPRDRTIQLWVWEPRGLPEPSEAFWKPVTIGYVCPGPGFLDGRHLVVTDQGVPKWITGATRYRRYNTANAPSTAPHGQPGA